MLATKWKKGLVCLLGCWFFGSVIASPSSPANLLDGHSPDSSSHTAESRLNVNYSGNVVMGDPVACAIGEGRWGGGPPVDAERWSDVSEDLLLVGARGPG